MSAQRIHTMKRHDTAPPISVQICDDRGIPVSLAGATLPRFLMVNATSGAVKVDAAASIESGSAGVIAYNWSSQDTDESGTFSAEFEVILSGGKKLTLPTEGVIVVRIFPDIGNA